jgi:hypothetical protein
MSLDPSRGTSRTRAVGRVVVRTLSLTAIYMVSSAHVGSPDAWYEGPAGPYRVTVQVKMPGVVPGVAQILVRVAGDPVNRVTVFANKFDATGGTPPPEVAERVTGDTGLWSAKLWLMAGGSNSVNVGITGPSGSGAAVVPVLNVATRRLGLNRGMGIGLTGMGVFLFLGLVTIVGAAARESTLAPGEQPSHRNYSRARIAMGASSLIVALILFGGWKWWGSEDQSFTRSIFKPLPSQAKLTGSATAPHLDFRIIDSAWVHRSDTAWLRKRDANSWTPLIADHGKLMHLFLVREDLGAMAHLHPQTSDTVLFPAALPSLPAGRYRAFADIVHESGFTQTLVTSIDIPANVATTHAIPTDADDSWFEGTPARNARAAMLADGSTMTWVASKLPLVAGREAGLAFDVRNRDGSSARLQPYMGMQAHALVARDDGSVFVHLHPLGTISIASQLAYELRQPGDSVRGRLGKRISAEMSAMRDTDSVPSSVSFPFAFPKAGNYRIWVQVRKDGRILTGAFDAVVGAGVTPAG